jgi:hypothetical protein
LGCFLFGVTDDRPLIPFQLPTIIKENRKIIETTVKQYGADIQNRENMGWNWLCNRSLGRHWGKLPVASTWWQAQEPTIITTINHYHNEEGTKTTNKNNPNLYICGVSLWGIY